MKLFNVQDSDRPMWVIADSYGHAVERWKVLVAKENDMWLDDVEDPQGVHFVCDHDELLP